MNREGWLLVGRVTGVHGGMEFRWRDHNGELPSSDEKVILLAVMNEYYCEVFGKESYPSRTMVSTLPETGWDVLYKLNRWIDQDDDIKMACVGIHVEDTHADPAEEPIEF